MGLRICFVASEVAPLAKTGGLADVAGALPRYLCDDGHDVRVFMPFYSTIATDPLGLSAVAAAQDVPITIGTREYRFSVFAGTLPRTNVPLHLIQCPALFNRAALYTNDADEHVRFLLLQRAVLETFQRLQFAPQILHCNDWHTALLPLMLKTTYAWDRLFAATRTLMSIHNIGYQGVFPLATFADIGLRDPVPLQWSETFAARDVDAKPIAGVFEAGECGVGRAYAEGGELRSGPGPKIDSGGALALLCHCGILSHNGYTYHGWRAENYLSRRLGSSRRASFQPCRNSLPASRISWAASLAPFLIACPA